MKAKTTLFILAAAAVLTACTTESDNPKGSVAARITAGVSGPKARAVDNRWNADHIGVMVEGESSTMSKKYKNVEYVTQSTGTSASFTPLNSNGGIFFEDSSNDFIFSAYAPYASSTDISTLPGNGGKIAVSTIAQLGAKAQESIDYIYATGAMASKSSPIVSFTNKSGSGGSDCSFKHKMARLILKVQVSTDDGFTDKNVLERANFKLGGLIHEGTFDVTNGTATATGSVVNDWVLREFSGSGTSVIVRGNCTANFDSSTGVMTFTMILLPQTLADNLVFAVSPADGEGQTYVNKDVIKPALQAGYSYTYTITVKKTGLVVSGSTIEDWNDGGNYEGDATMQGI